MENIDIRCDKEGGVRIAEEDIETIISRVVDEIMKLRLSSLTRVDVFEFIPSEFSPEK